MLTLDEIETAIRQLPEHSIRELTHRLSDYLEDQWDQWDQQLKSDLASGKLDSLIANAEKAIAANQVKELDEILDNS